MLASGLGSFGLGVAAFYLNFVYRALGFGDLAIGALAAATALGGVVGAWPAWRLARSYSRRAALLLGGTVTGAGVVAILVFDALGAQLAAAALLGAGGMVVYATGLALLADASAQVERPKRFAQRIAVGTIAAFLAAYLAGQAAVPVAALLAVPADSLLVVRVLVGAGGLIAALSAIPILLVRAAPVPHGSLDAPVRRALMLRFALIEALFGFGAGSFLPFINLFFADRFGLAFSAIGLALGVIAVGGSAGALIHGMRLAARFGQIRSVVAVELASVPFALAAALAPVAPVAAVVLTARAALMYGASATYSAFQLSSFRPAERAGVTALLAIAWNGAAAGGSVLSGAVRAALGDVGWTVNLVTLAAAYTVAASLVIVLFRAHEPRGDAVPDVEGAAQAHSTS